MKHTLRPVLALLVSVLFCASPAVLGDGSCTPARPLTAAEQQWLDRQLAAIDSALAAPGDWLRFDRSELDGGARALERPDSVCTGIARYAMQLRTEAHYAPRGSALARRVEVARRLQAVRQQEQRLEPGPDTSGLAAQSMDHMRLQQELMAAMQRGDAAAVERLGKQMEQASAGHQAAVDRAQQHGANDMQRRQEWFEEGMRLERELADLEEPARSSPRVSVSVSVNSTGGAARDKSGARDLGVPGAKFAWLNTETGCGDGGTTAWALFGDFSLDPWEAGDARIFQLNGAASSYAQWRGAAVMVCGAATDAEKFIRHVRGDALRP